MYRAINKYGIDKFKVETICECQINELNKKEMEYIKLYNSYKKGYNASLGGCGLRTLELTDEEIVNTYLSTKNINETCRILNTTHHRRIASTLKKHKIDKFEKEKILIDVYKNEKLVNHFESLVDAGNWIIYNNLTKEKNVNSVASRIRKSIIVKEKAYGYIFKSDYYNDEYIMKRNLSYINKRYKSKNNKTKDNKICPKCGDKMFRKSNVCKKCFYMEKHGIKMNNISKEYLKQLIRNTSFSAIGKKYNVSDNTIRNWCKKYKLPYKASEIKRYTNEQWELI